jgi:hypothetical protein
MTFRISPAGDGFYFVTDEAKDFAWSEAGDRLGFTGLEYNNRLKFQSRPADF